MTEDARISKLETKIAVVDATISTKMTSIEEKVNNLTLLVEKSSRNNEKFLLDVKDFMSSFMGNYVPLTQWNEHIKEDAQNEQKLNALWSRLDKIESEEAREKAIKGVYLQGWKGFIYPVILLTVTTIVTLVLNKLLGL